VGEEDDEPGIDIIDPIVQIVLEVLFVRRNGSALFLEGFNLLPKELLSPLVALGIVRKGLKGLNGVIATNNDIDGLKPDSRHTGTLIISSHNSV